MDGVKSIRRIGADLPRHMGLKAVLVSDGAEALSEFCLARESGRPFDLIILDLTVPGGTGG